MTIICVLLLMYFIKQQFEFERPRRFTYIIVPVITFVLFIENFVPSQINLISVAGIIILGVIAGMFQGFNAQIKEVLTDNNEKRVKIKGGWPYLLGWLLILITQIGISVFLKGTEFSIIELSKEIVNLILEELLPFRKFDEESWWALWALSTSSSITYTFILSRRSEYFRETIKRGARRRERNRER